MVDKFENKKELKKVKEQIKIIIINVKESKPLVYLHFVFLVASGNISLILLHNCCLLLSTCPLHTTPEVDTR